MGHQGRRRERGTAARLAATLLAVATVPGLAACDPAPASLVVTSTADTPDAVPGDGVCEATPGAGDCTLRAAIQEGNALGAAAVTVPAGGYFGADLTITGQLSINVGAPQVVTLGSPRITVEPGARLEVDGIGASAIPGPSILVRGTLLLRRSTIVAFEAVRPVVAVEPGATAYVESSLLAQAFSPGTPAVRNDGTLVLRHATVHGLELSQPVLQSSGTTLSAASAVSRCSGPVLPTSLGSNVSLDGSCGWTGTGDQNGVAPLITVVTVPLGFAYTLPAASPLVDRVPVGVLGCGDPDVGDLLGTARPVDGDGDGIAACDVGAVERPA